MGNRFKGKACPTCGHEAIVPIADRIMELAREGLEITAALVVARFGVPRNSVYNTLSLMCSSGELKRVRQGVYIATLAERAQYV